MVRRTILLLLFSLGALASAHAQAPTSAGCEAVPRTTNCKLLADFEGDDPLRKWRATVKRELVKLSAPKAMLPTQKVTIEDEEDNRFARLYTEDQSFRVVLSHKHSLDWHLEKRSYLRWTWRAKKLPDGANEKESSANDTGGAVYVTFDTDWLGRPRSIKYTYSSALPVGTTVDYGPVQVLVVASKNEQGLDQWITHERNVVEDYERLFGGSPDATPLAFMMWSDSDSVHDKGIIDFDNIMLLSEPSDSQSTAVSSK